MNIAELLQMAIDRTYGETRACIAHLRDTLTIAQLQTPVKIDVILFLADGLPDTVAQEAKTAMILLCTGGGFGYDC